MAERTRNEMLRASATEMAGWLRTREVTSVGLVGVHVDQVRRTNHRVNAVVAERFEAAMEEAEAADGQLRAGGDLPPLLGVPCTVKEEFALTGMPHTAGLVSRKGRVAERDSTTVARLRGAGAIPLGVTNTSELGLWMESFNKVYGRTDNPYDPRRSAGGSSGGEGAAVGAGMVPFGLASDIGGSVRIPAFFNGVFGHKPSGGCVPNTGYYPLAENDALRFQCPGPITRRAADLMPLLGVLAGPDDEDPVCAPVDLGNPGDVEIEGLRVWVIPGDGRFRVDDELATAQARAASALEQQGAKVEALELPELKHSFEIWSAFMSEAEETSFKARLADGGELRLGREMLRWFAGRSPFTLPTLGMAVLEKLPALLGDRAQRFLDLGDQLRSRLDEVLEGQAVILYPPYRSPAPKHYRPLVPPIQMSFTMIWNVMHLPATAVPLGLSRRGLPLGVQVVGAHGADHRTIAVAMELERRFGGWVPPLGFV